MNELAVKLTTRHSGYVVSDRFYRRVFYSEQGVEPVLVADAKPENDPKVLFLVRYFIGEGAGGEIRRPIFKNELSGYDYVSALDYPAQDTRLENLQFLIESHMYGAVAGTLVTSPIQSKTTGQIRQVKVIISAELVEELMRTYDFAW
jgi:hypothetical protein